MSTFEFNGEQAPDGYTPLMAFATLARIRSYDVMINDGLGRVKITAPWLNGETITVWGPGGAFGEWAVSFEPAQSLHVRVGPMAVEARSVGEVVMLDVRKLHDSKSVLDFVIALRMERGEVAA